MSSATRSRQGSSVAADPTVANLTPSQLAKRWSVSVGHLANQRSARCGPSYIKLSEGGRVLYPLYVIQRHEAARLVEVTA